MKLVKSKTNKRRLKDVQAALEISRSDLNVVVVDRTRGEPEVRVQHQLWGDGAGPLHTEQGAQALTEALGKLVTAEQLAGAGIILALNSDYCVTRVVTGEKDEVRHELKSLDDRSSLYLSLGTGDNTAAVCSKSLDAKHQQAFATIANKRTLDVILEAIRTVGLHVDVVEHSLVALARAVGVLERDVEEPVLVLEINQRGVDLGISYRGQLMLDYRPGGTSAKTHVASIVTRHLERLQRYCNKRFRFASGKLSQIFLCGDPSDVALVFEQFSNHARLRAEVIDPQELLRRCSLPVVDATSNFTPCIGALLQPPPGTESMTPNLLGAEAGGPKTPLLPALIKTAWPIAAAILLVAAIMGATSIQKMRCAALERREASIEEARAELNSLQMEKNMLQQRHDYIRLIATQVRPPRWTNLMDTVTGVLPNGVWLDRLSVDTDGGMHITGSSQSLDTIYDGVAKLKELPNLTNVALESTQPRNFNGMEVTSFEITCRLGTPADKEKGKK